MKKFLIFGLIAASLASCYVPDDLHIGDNVLAYEETGSVVGQVVGINRGFNGLVAVKLCDGRYLAGSRKFIIKLPYEGPFCVPKL